MKIKKAIDKNIISTLWLILGLGLCFLTSYLLVNHIAMGHCFETLNDATLQMAADIKSNVDRDLERMDIFSDIISEHADVRSEEAKDYLRSFHQYGRISALAILTPENEMVIGNDNYAEVEETLDFQTELGKIPYISGVNTSVSDRERKYLYLASPIEKEGKILGILYGFVDLRELPRTYSVLAFSGNSQLYVVDGSTGDFLIDTWHDTLGNIYDEDFSSRKVKPGNDFKAMKDDIVSGKSGYIVFFSQNAKEYFYSFYMPVGINRWMVQLTIPESIAFAHAARIRSVLYFLAAGEMLFLLIYFMRVLFRVRREASAKEEKLSQTLYMYDVQQTLFDAHQNPKLIIDALRKVAQMMTSKCAFLIDLDGTSIKKVYSWPAEELSCGENHCGVDISRSMPNVSRCLTRGESVLYYPQNGEHEESEGNDAVFGIYGVSNFMLTPVLDADNRLNGVLGVVDMRHVWEDASLLQCIVRNFMMALNNMNSYQLIQEMGATDALTGLRNRNSYQQFLRSSADICLPQETPSFCCIYLDANGLHEINNHLGHASGDRMLAFIGKTLKEYFGSDASYRIGGDEFIVFCRGCSEAEVEDKIAGVRRQLDTQEYQVSIGLAWQKDLQRIERLVSEAEHQMYESKHIYYQKKGNAAKVREMNRKLEQILQEKEDADTFLSIISSYFMGAYVVNLNTDHTRVIYIPSYFAELLEQADYIFSEAIRQYVDDLVLPADRQGFLEFIDYQSIDRAMQVKRSMEHRYRKPDGKQVILRIYPASDYTADKRETFWLFEEYDG